MRILFVGAVDFSYHCLKELIKLGGNVVAVLTLAKEDARLNSDYKDLSVICSRNGIRVYQIRKINEPTSIDLIISLKPDIIFVFGWSQLISKEILSIPPLGCIGTHPALLPRNRGRHPLIWALVEGLSESGLTFFYICEGMDDGDILWQKSFSITAEDDASTLYDKVKRLASEAIEEFLPQLENGTAPRVVQDHGLATYWRKRGESDGQINWSDPSAKIHNLIRALTHPYVGAHTFHKSSRVTVWRARLGKELLSHEAIELDPGTVIERGDLYANVRTGDGYISILECQGLDEIKIGMRLGDA
jgi:methionyl-tRNA formyltransferase